MEKNRIEKCDSLKIKEENRDLWYEKMANKPSRQPKDEPSVTWMEYFDLLEYCKN